MEVKSGVYQIILKEDGRSYIGSATNIDDRWRAHGNNALNENLKIKQVISHAIKKYGADSFEWKVLEYCDESQLLDREQYWLDIVQPFVSNGNGFNVRKTANSNLGIVRSVESRTKQSNSMKNKPKTETHKVNMSLSWYKNRGAEYFLNLSEKIKGDKNPAKRPEVRKKISEAMTGKTWKHDADRMKKHRERLTGRKYTEDQKKRMSTAQTGLKRSAEAKESFYLAQRVLYRITSPIGEEFIMYSRELKEFCSKNNLGYANLITTAKTKKPYKKGWLAEKIEDK